MLCGAAHEVRSASSFRRRASTGVMAAGARPARSGRFGAARARARPSRRLRALDRRRRTGGRAACALARRPIRVRRSTRRRPVRCRRGGRRSRAQPVRGRCRPCSSAEAPVCLVEDEDRSIVVHVECRRADRRQRAPGFESDVRRTVTPRRFDDPGSAKCCPERVPTEMHVRRIEEWEGPVGRVGSASGHEEALVVARGPKLGVILESFAPRSDLLGHRRGQLPDSIVRRRFEQQRTERPMLRRCGDGPLPRWRSRARDPRCRRAHSGRRRRDERVRPGASGAVVGASRRRRREGRPSTGGLWPWRRRLPRATPGCSRPQCLQALRRICASRASVFALCSSVVRYDNGSAEKALGIPPGHIRRDVVSLT